MVEKRIPINEDVFLPRNKGKSPTPFAELHIIPLLGGRKEGNNLQFASFALNQRLNRSSIQFCFVHVPVYPLKTKYVQGIKIKSEVSETNQKAVHSSQGRGDCGDWGGEDGLTWIFPVFSALSIPLPASLRAFFSSPPFFLSF